MPLHNPSTNAPVTALLVLVLVVAASIQTNRYFRPPVPPVRLL